MLNRVSLIAVIAVALASAAFSQALGEYGGMLSKSTTAGATGGLAAGSSISGSTRRAADALGGRASQSEHGIVTVPHQRPQADTLEATMRANKHKLEERAGAKGARVQIASVPSKTAVYVDGVPIAYAPAEFRLPAGKHAIELRHPAFLLWREELSLASGETRRLEPKLAMMNKNQVLVSFDK